MESKQKTIKVSLSVMAKEAGISLEADSFDDVYHGGYSKKDVLNQNLYFSKKMDDVEKLFPLEVGMEMENLERANIADAIVQARIDGLKDSLEKIQISNKCGVESVSIDQSTNQIIMVINNPVQLINTIVDGVGLISADLTEDSSISDIEASIHNIWDFFKVYPESPASFYLDDRYTPDCNSEDLEENLAFRLKELSIEEVAEYVKECLESSRLDEKRIWELTKLTSFSKKEIKEKIIEIFHVEASNALQKAADFKKKMETSEDVNESILEKRMEMYNEKSGPRVGDWLVKKVKGEDKYYRFSHNYGDSLQISDGGSFYLGEGYISFSGSLEPSIPLEKMEDTGEKKLGQVWFFKNDIKQAENGITLETEFRVYRLKE